MTTKRLNVGILVFDEVEVLDFCGPFEVFATAAADGDDDDENGEGRLFSALIIAEHNRTITCRGGLLVQPNHTIADHPPLDIIVIPGGFGTRREIDNPPVLEWIAAQSRQVRLTTSVCTGAFLLAKNGLLDGRRATTHWASIDWLRDHFPEVTVVADERVIDEARSSPPPGSPPGSTWPSTSSPGSTATRPPSPPPATWNTTGGHRPGAFTHGNRRRTRRDSSCLRMTRGARRHRRHPEGTKDLLP